MSDVRIGYVALTVFEAAERNPKLHDIEQIKASLRRFGFVSPVAVNETTGRLVAGHGRIESLRQMKAAGDAPPARVKVDGGEWFIPCLRGVSFASDAEAEAYLIADNKLVEAAGWDEEMLGQMVKDLSASLQSAALDGVGIDERDVTRLLNKLEPTHAGPVAAPKEKPPAVTKPGDLWALGQHRILCGDSLNQADVERLMGGERLTMIHADPPYGMGKEADGVANDNIYDEKLDDFQVAWWRAWSVPLADNGSLYIWGCAPDLWRLWWKRLVNEPDLLIRNEIVWAKGSAFGMSSAVLTAWLPTIDERAGFYFWSAPMQEGAAAADGIRATGLHIQSQIIWNKNALVLGQADYQWKHETAWYAFWLGKKHRWLGERDKTTVWEVAKVAHSEYVHPMQKPTELYAIPMRHHTYPGEIVAEPFSGSGSQIIAAESLGRRCFAMELEPKFVDAAIERWERMTGNKAQREE